jgi:hypothetical protein
MSFGPVLTFWAWRRWPMYPLDALGLFVVPLAAPFVVARAARIAFVALFGIHLTRSADAILIVVGVGAWLVGTITFARIFSRYAQLPGPPARLVSAMNARRRKRSNQAMQLTASKPAVYASSVCRRSVCCVACTEGSRQLILCLVRCDTVAERCVIVGLIARSGWVSRASLEQLSIDTEPSVARHRDATRHAGASQRGRTTSSTAGVGVHARRRDCVSCGDGDSSRLRAADARPKPSNQAMQLTASKPAVYASVSAVVSVCCVACTEGSRQLILCLVRC